MTPTFVALLEGNAAHAAEFDSRFDTVQNRQRPEAVTVSCSDSRVLQDHMWDNDDPGRLFTCSNIGNRVAQRTGAGRSVSGDVLYPIAHAETDLAVVVGHTGCGAITATYDVLTGRRDDDLPGIAGCVDLLAPGLDPGVAALPDDVDRAGAVNRLVEYNVDRQVEALVDSADVPASVDVVGVVYDFQDVYDDRRGTVHVVNVDGETDPGTLRAAHPSVASRVRRLWTP